MITQMITQTHPWSDAKQTQGMARVLQTGTWQPDLPKPLFAELAGSGMEGIGTEHEHPSEPAGAVTGREWHWGCNIAGAPLHQSCRQSLLSSHVDSHRAPGF